MRLLTLPRPGELAWREVLAPEPATGEVRLRVANVGICGSDIEVFQGRRPAPIRHGCPVIGHEGSGVIDALGPGVGGLRVGDRATCVEGWGALADHLITSPTNLLVVEERIDLADACLVEVLPGVAMAAWRTGIGRSCDVLVVGQGLSGLLLTRLVSIHGCRRLVVLDPSVRKASLAREFGADDAREGLLADLAVDLRSDYPNGFDVAILATSRCLVDDVVPLMRPRSRVIVYGGLEDAVVDVMALHRRSVSLVKEGEGINGVLEARGVWREALQLVYDGLLPLTRLRTHDFSFAEAARAFAVRVDDPDAIHVVLHNNGPIPLVELP